MANFLLWNVQRKPLDALVLALVEEHAVDGVFLVEYPGPGGQLSDTLATAGFRELPYHFRFGVFTRDRFLIERLPPFGPRTRDVFLRATLPDWVDVLFVLVHGFDRRNKDDNTRSLQFRDLADRVRAVEQASGHKRTIVLGDFNSSPYEPAMVAAHGLHAVGVRAVRGRTNRRVGGTDCDFFYNPMWRLFGHGSDAGSATHYYVGYDSVEHVWHMPDQVIVRPEVLGQFDERRLRILTTASGRSLVTGIEVPDAGAAYDHLPIDFGMKD
jgi:hypothetical protein